MKKKNSMYKKKNGKFFLPKNIPAVAIRAAHHLDTVLRGGGPEVDDWHIEEEEEEEAVHELGGELYHGPVVELGLVKHILIQIFYLNEN